MEREAEEVDEVDEACVGMGPVTSVGHRNKDFMSDGVGCV
jgi:hypothetical protein